MKLKCDKTSEIVREMTDSEKAESIIKLINDYDINSTFLFGWQIEFIEKLCRKQLNNGWIPVSERLPNIGETVLLTVAVNRGISHEYGSVDIAWICDKENKCFYGTDGKYSYDEAIAWQPLPEPYKEVEK